MRHVTVMDTDSNNPANSVSGSFLEDVVQARKKNHKLSI